VLLVVKVLESTEEPVYKVTVLKVFKEQVIVTDQSV